LGVCLLRAQASHERQVEGDYSQRTNRFTFHADVSFSVIVVVSLPDCLLLQA
jgi:hypothetical protein